MSLVMLQGGLQRLGSVDTATISDHHDRLGLRGLGKGLHELMDKLSKFIGIEMGDGFPKDPVGAILHGTDHRE